MCKECDLIGNITIGELDMQPYIYIYMCVCIFHNLSTVDFII